jgi:hypothetical protein
VKRFEDLPEDYGLLRVMEDLSVLFNASRLASEKIRILEAALSEIGQRAIGDVEVAEGRFDYVPLDLNTFFSLLFELEQVLAEDPDYKHTDKPHRPCSFIEVGCGPGRNLHLLKATDRFCFDKISGFDVVKNYIDVGRTFFDLGEDIFLSDAMEFDYGSYDLIYFYKPFSDDDLQTRFENRIITTMKRGAYIACSLDVSLDGSRSLIRKGREHSIWKKL